MRTIISGGQTGADMGGLLAGKSLSSFKTAGYAPKNYVTENGCNYELVNYGLIQSKVMGYEDRDRRNAQLCDIMIAFRLSKPLTGRGTTKTYNFAAHGKYLDSIEPRFNSVNGLTEMNHSPGHRPVMIVWDVLTHPNKSKFVSEILKFVLKYDYGELKIMISGPCESTCPGIQNGVYCLLREVLLQLPKDEPKKYPK